MHNLASQHNYIWEKHHHHHEVTMSVYKAFYYNVVIDVKRSSSDASGFRACLPCMQTHIQSPGMHEQQFVRSQSAWTKVCAVCCFFVRLCMLRSFVYLKNKVTLNNNEYHDNSSQQLYTHMTIAYEDLMQSYRAYASYFVCLTNRILMVRFVCPNTHHRICVLAQDDFR